MYYRIKTQYYIKMEGELIHGHTHLSGETFPTKEAAEQAITMLRLRRTSKRIGEKYIIEPAEPYEL